MLLSSLLFQSLFVVALEVVPVPFSKDIFILNELDHVENGVGGGIETLPERSRGAVW